MMHESDPDSDAGGTLDSHRTASVSRPHRQRGMPRGFILFLRATCVCVLFYILRATCIKSASSDIYQFPSASQ